MKPQDKTDLFVDTLYSRINAYFIDNRTSIKTSKRMNIKIVTSVIWWLGSYALIFLFSTNFLSFLAFYLFHAFSHIFFSFNVGHDALHDALSRKREVNRFWAYSYDVLGVNTYMWRYMHHKGHHACLNVEGEDASLATAGFFRLSTNATWKPIYRYQHLYSFILYGLYLPYYFFVKDYKYFFSKGHPHIKNIKHPLAEWVKLFAGKLTYLAYMFVIPYYYFDFPWYAVFLVFLAGLFMIGIVMSFTFQVTHIADTTSYPTSNSEYAHHAYHVINTTADYSTHRHLANWFFGGLNQHVIHHLRSDICHIHYPELTKIVVATCQEFGINYRQHNSFYTAIKAHLRQLKKLGMNPETNNLVVLTLEK